jgi:predicted MFS family arabinose efflux permease
VPAVDAPRARYRDALASVEFRAVLAASAISTCGTVVAAVALTVLVYERTHSPFLSSLTFALGFLPYVVSGLLLSSLVDRLPPRRLLVGADLACAALVAPMAWSGTPIPVLLALLLLVATVGSLANGTRGGVVRAVVTDAAYVPARSLVRIASQTAQIGGNGVGGLLLVALSPQALILANAVSFVASATLTRVFLARRPAVGTSGPLLRDSLHGARTVLGNRPVRRLLLLGWLVPAFSVFPESIAAPYVLAQDGSRALVGWWLAALPLGVVAGDLLGVWLLGPRLQQRLIVPLAALSFVPYLAFVVSPPVGIALPLLALAGLGAAYSLGLDALLRDAIPLERFSRAMAINQAGLMTSQGLGFAAAGAIAQALSPGATTALAGASGLAVVALLRPASPRRARAARPRTRGWPPARRSRSRTGAGLP